MHLLLSILVVGTVMLLGACKTGPVPIKEDVTPAEVFQLAQEAAIEERDYETALHYYGQVKELFPNDEESKIIADYEIAFIHYKTERTDEARDEFQAIIDRYEEEDAGRLPSWPPVLAEKLIQKIDEQ